MARTAEVKRDARIGEAEATKDSQIKEAIAEEERMAAKYSNDTEIAKAQRDFELKKATYDMEVQAKVSLAYHYFYLEKYSTRTVNMMLKGHLYLKAVNYCNILRIVVSTEFIWHGSLFEFHTTSC